MGLNNADLNDEPVVLVPTQSEVFKEAGMYGLYEDFEPNEELVSVLRKYFLVGSRDSKLGELS